MATLVAAPVGDYINRMTLADHNPPATSDIAVIGAGPAGLMAAILLARDGHNITLIGPAGQRRDGRTVALLDGSWRMLEEIGLTDDLAAISAPLATMRLVDDTGSLFRRPPSEFRAREIDLDQFGWNVELSALTEALEAAAAETPGLDRRTAVVEHIRLEHDHADLMLSDGVPLQTRLVVGADGRRSRVREEAGITSRAWSYPQVALTTIVAHDRDHGDISTEFHTRAGPCTTVPMPGRRSSIVWMMSPEQGERLMAASDTALADAIEAQIHAILGTIRIDGPRGLTPMSGLSVERFASRRAMLVGEAAHAFPPIGAQGLNLGFRDVNALRKAVAGADDPGADPVLAAYDRSRRIDVMSRTGAVDMLNRSLLSHLLPVDLARGLGLLTLDSFAPLRRFVMRQGMAGQAR